MPKYGNGRGQKLGVATRIVIGIQFKSIAKGLKYQFPSRKRFRHTLPTTNTLFTGLLKDKNELKMNSKMNFVQFA